MSCRSKSWIDAAVWTVVWVCEVLKVDRSHFVGSLIQDAEARAGALSAEVAILFVGAVEVVHGKGLLSSNEPKVFGCIADHLGISRGMTASAK